MAHHHNVWLISVPTGAFLGASDEQFGPTDVFVRKRIANEAATAATRCCHEGVITGVIL